MAGQFGLSFRLPRKSQGSATWDRRLYFPSEGGHAVDFFDGFGRDRTHEQSTRGQHANHYTTEDAAIT
jgi:hypothetical protein